MGIKSLASYLQHHSNSRTYFEDYALLNCKLVIDGGSIPIALYNWKYSHWTTGYSPDCYGGDYDRYAHIVRGFFRLLEKANITPLIVFGTRKMGDNLPLIKERLNKQCEIASKITSSTERLKNRVELESSEELTRKQRQMKQVILKATVPPAGLKYAFRDLANELNLKVLTVEGDADQQIASYARELNCPVLSADSDFFLLGSMFVPISTVQINPQNVPDVGLPEFIPCKVYRFEKLVDSLNQGPDKEFIPYLLPVLLGNDYINEDIFNSFFDTFIQYDREFKYKRIKGLIQWLNNLEFLESALRDILNSFATDEEKRSVFMKIKRVMKGYSPVLTGTLRKRFCSSVCSHQHDLSPTFINFETLEEALGLQFEEIRNTENLYYIVVSGLFMTRIFECRYPAFFLEMVREDVYVLPTNLEDKTRPDANSIAYTIISAIYKIFMPSNDKKLTVLRRNSDNLMEEHVLPAFTDQLPSMENIEHLFSEERQGILLKILEIDQNFLELFERHSEECHLFLLTLKYTVLKSELEPSFRYSIILCFIILNYVDTNLGGGLLYRTHEDLQYHHFGIDPRSAPPRLGQAYAFIHNIMKYFRMDPHDTDENYDRGVIHSIAEFQCVFLHLKYLNNVLNFPFQDAPIYKIFNGTFVYNMIKNLREQTNPKNYCLRLLNDCPLFREKISFGLLQKHSIL